MADFARQAADAPMPGGATASESAQAEAFLSIARAVRERLARTAHSNVQFGSESNTNAGGQ
jgi:hypothetical protein